MGPQPCEALPLYMQVESLGIRAHTIRQVQFGPYDPYCMLLRVVSGSRCVGCGGDAIALCWFASYEYAIGSFVWYCHQHVLKPEPVRGRIRDAVSKSSLPTEMVSLTRWHS